MLRVLKRRPRRILMTVDAVGGVWTYALGLARALAAENCRVVLAGLGPEPSPAQIREAEATAALTWLAEPLDWMAASEAELERVAAALAGLARDHAVELLHLNAPGEAHGLDVALPVVAVSHSCVATWFQAVRGTGLPPEWSWQHDRNRAGFDRADLVLAPSRSHAAMLESCYGPVPRLEVIHNAAGRGPRAEVRQNVVVAAARWWDDGKNARVLDEAAALCAVPCLAIGPAEGPNGQRMEFRNAVPIGQLGAGEARRSMAHAAIFASPSLYEPFGLAVLEAALAGTPLVLADIPTYRELWEDAALFFPPRDAGALAKTLSELSRDAAARRRLGILAARRARRYSPVRHSASMLAAYEQATLTAARR